MQNVRMPRNDYSLEAPKAEDQDASSPILVRTSAAFRSFFVRWACANVFS